MGSEEEKRQLELQYSRLNYRESVLEWSPGRNTLQQFQGHQKTSTLGCLTDTSTYFKIEPHTTLKSSPSLQMAIPSFQLFKPKTWESPLTALFCFFHTLHLIHQQIMSGIPSKNIQDLTNSDYLHFDYLGPRHHHPPGLLSTALAHSPVYSKYSNQRCFENTSHSSALNPTMAFHSTQSKI